MAISILWMPSTMEVYKNAGAAFLLKIHQAEWPYCYNHILVGAS